MVEQQYYTRERGGLFSQTDGYDTVAKTPLLKPEYIKKNIHPLCNYDTPVELQKRGETDEAKYPPNFIIFPAPTGELIVGQAVYKSKDFTGLRSTFFMHNFVLSEKERRRYVKEPEKLFGITGFATSYSEEEGRELPTLAGIPYEGGNPYFKDRSLLFSKLGMDDVLFHKLMYATFVAVNSKKKIFIVLDVPIEELGEMSKALLYHLYLEMPWNITEKLGVCTYSNKLETKKSIQITFLDQHTLRYDGKLNKEFIFDFVNRKFLNVDEDMESEPYMRICAQYKHNKTVWEKFNKWADELRLTLKDKEEKGLEYYSKVAILLDMSLHLKARADYDMTQSKVRTGLMNDLLKEIKGKVHDEIRVELIELLEYTIDLLYGHIASGELFTIDEVEALLHFKLQVNAGILEQETHCILIILELLEEASYQGETPYIEAILELVRSYPDTYIHLYQAIYERPQLKQEVAYAMIDKALRDVTTLEELISKMQELELIEPIHLYQAIYERPQLKQEVAYAMIDKALRDVTTLEELISKMQELELIEPILLLDSYYSQKIYDVFDSCLHAAEDKVKLLLQMQKWCQNREDDLYYELLEECESYFIEHVNLKEIDSEATLCALEFSHFYPEENYETIKDYQSLRTDLSFMSPQNIRINSNVQELVKMFHKQNLRGDDFYMIVYAFLEEGEEGYELQMDLKKVLSYLNGVSTTILLDFIIWSKGQEIYINKGAFDEQVVDFFNTLKQKEGKIPKELIKTKLGEQAKTKALCEKILGAQKPTFLKWIGVFNTLKQKEGKIPKELIKTKLGEQAKTKALCEKILGAQKPTFLKWIGEHQKGVVVGGILLVIGIGVGSGAFYYEQSMNRSKAQENNKKTDIDLELRYKLSPKTWMNHQEAESYIKENQDVRDSQEVEEHNKPL